MASRTRVGIAVPAILAVAGALLPGPMAAVASAATGPSVTTPTVTPSIVPHGSTITVTTTATAATNTSSVSSVELQVDGGPWTGMAPADGWWYSRTEDATAFLPDGAAGIISAAAIGAGGNHTCALLADHTVRCWGDNSNGQLGDGTRVNRLSPVAVIGVTTATAIAAGQSSTCALLADATVTCWPVSGSLTPMAVAGITTATAIAGQGQMCALLADQTVRCWTSSSAPVAIDGITTATAISVGSYHACALLSDRSVRCWGANNWGQLGDGTQVSSASPVTVAGVNDAMAVSAGGYHTCALLVDGGIRCWGDNYTGELGDGSGSVKSFTPVTPVGIGPAIAISTFSHHTCALLADRTIRCWGFNYYGQLGNGTTTSSPVPVAVAGVESAIAISTGEEHSCALFADHTLHCWGRNWSGEYGDGTEVSRTSVDTLANGPHRVCVRASDGEWSDGSACSGFTVYDASLGVVTFAPLTTTPTSGAGVDYRLQFDTDVTGLASTSFSVAGSAAAGPGVCTVTPSSSSGTEFTVSVSGCSEGTLALTLHSGAVIGGGGALPPRDVGAPAVVIDRTPPGSSASIAAAYATGSTAAVTYLASDNLSGIVRVSAYYSGDPGLSSPTACGAVIGTATSGTVTCSIPALDGTYYVYTVATDAAGNVEEAPATPDASIIRDALAPGVSLTNVNGIARSFPVILKPSIASVGGACATGGGPISITLDGGATTPGTAACTSGAWLLTFSTAVGAEGVHMLSASQTNGSGHTAGTGAVSVRVDTTAPVVAGPSLSNELVDAGTPVTITSSATDPGGVASIQVSIEGGPWTSMNPVGGSWGGAVQTATSSVNAATTSITAGPYYTCTLLVDGTVRCWGFDWDGELGNGTTLSHQSTPVAVLDVSTATAVSAGGQSCVLLVDHTVWCWGNNRPPSAVVGITTAIAVSAGGGHACALLSDHSIECWGNNSHGELGDGTTVSRATPAPVAGITTATTIAAGSGYSCAVLGDGTVRCWGSNTSGQLGDGTTTQRTTPVPASGVSNAAAVAADDDHTCTLLVDGTMRCWGNNDSGQLGNGTTRYSLTPVPVSGISTATQIGLGGDTCAVLADGTVRCWGYNSGGQLGDGTTTTSLLPVPVSGISNATEVAVGSSHACALLADHAVRCWGWNSYGQLGDGTWTNRTSPVEVSGTAGLAGERYSVCVRATDLAGNMSSGAACTTLSVRALPQVTLQPSGKTVGPGQSVSFTAYGWGVPYTTVQWQVSADAGSTWVDIPGATSTTYSFSATAGANGWQFRAAFTNDVGSVTSNAAALTVDAAPPVVTVTSVNGTGVAFPYRTAAPITSIGGTCGTASGDETAVGVTVNGAFGPIGYVACITGFWSLALTPPISTDGTYVLAATQFDRTGNTGTSGGQTVVRDATSPSSAGSVSATVTNGTSVDVGYAAFDNLAGLASVRAYYATSATLTSPVFCGIAISSATSGTISCTIPSTDGTYYVFTRATDAAGNTEAAPLAADDSIILETVGPTATLTAPASPASAPTLSYTLTTSEPITGLAAPDFGVTGAGCVVGTPTGIASPYTVPVTDCAEGSVTLALLAGSITDLAGNAGPAVDAVAASVTVDWTAPTVTTFALEAGSDSGRLNNDRLTNALVLTYDLAFSEPVTGLAGDDFGNAGTATGCAFTPSAASGTTFTVTANFCNDGTVIATVRAGAVADAAGTPAPDANLPAATVTVDRAVPTVALTAVTGSPTSTTALTFSLISLSGQKALDCGTLSATPGTDFSFTGISALGTITGIGTTTCTIPATSSIAPGSTGTSTLAAASGFSVTDDTGNVATTASRSPVSITVDRQAPGVTLTATPTTSPTNATAFSVTVTFTEPVTGFALGDVTLGGTSNGWSASNIGGSGSVYTFTISASSPSDGSLTIGIPAAAATDLAGTPSTASNTMTYAIDRTPPGVTIPTLSSTSVAPGATVTVTSGATDGSGVASAEVNVNGGTWSALSAADGAFGGTSEGLTASITAPSTPGSYQVCVRATDTPGNTSTGSACATLTVTAPTPAITSFTPTIGSAGTVVSITGTNLTSASAVSFNGTAATTFTVASATSITATVPAGTTTGPISVTTPGGSATSTGLFTVTLAAPTITGFTPSSGPAGTVITLTGTNLGAVTAAKVNATAVTAFTVLSPTSLQVTVPAGASTGKLSVTTPAGTAASSTSFTLTVPAPAITSFSPASAGIGSVVTLTGSGLSGATAVKVNGTAVTKVTVVGPTSLVLTVPTGATTGKVTVTTAGGTATSGSSLTIGKLAAPVLAYSGTTVATPGATVTLSATLKTAGGVAITGATVSFTLNGSTTTATTTTSGVASVSRTAPTTPGFYPANVAFAGNSTYAATSALSTLAVAKPAPKLTYTGATTAVPGAVITLSATLKTAAGAAIAGSTVFLTFNGATYALKSSSTGVVSIATTAPTSTGSFAVTATLASDPAYANASATGTLSVALPTATLAYTGPTTATHATSITMSATLKTSAGAAIVGRTISFTLNKVTYTGVTDTTGTAKATATAPATAGNYTIAVKFAGDTSYATGSKNATLKVS